MLHFCQTNLSPSSATPHSNHFPFRGSHPRRCTGMASNNSFEKMTPLMPDRGKDDIESTQQTRPANFSSLAPCHACRILEGSTIQYSMTSYRLGRSRASQDRISTHKLPP